jgi:putative hydrolase of the HAD superfamily
MAAGAVVLWDFDGTLAFRPGLWAGCLVETLDEHEPGHDVDVAAVRPLLRDGFPWHTPDVAHPELSSGALWWARVEALLARAYAGVGYPPERALELAEHAHRNYVDCSRGWRLFDDVVPALDELRGRGWRHVILSNHVPELGELVAGLGLGAYFDVVLTSAEIGYEKPHPQAFAHALERCGGPGRVWMVGDNPVADQRGAEAVGIPAILVRHDGADLREAVRLVGFP